MKAVASWYDLLWPIVISVGVSFVCAALVVIFAALWINREQ